MEILRDTLKETLRDPNEDPQRRFSEISKSVQEKPRISSICPTVFRLQKVFKLNSELDNFEA